MHSNLLLLLFVAGLGVVGCSSGGGSNPPASATVDVVAAEGATITTPAGIELEIPPGALSADTTITVRGLTPTSTDGEAAFGVQFEPDGLQLSSPATLRLPLPDGWQDPAAERYDFRGADPAAMVAELDQPTLVRGVAEMPVSHFSGIVCAQVCHAGTIRHILSRFEERGCARADVLDHVRARYPGVDIPDDGCGDRSPEAVQALLDTFFEDRAGFAAGEPVGAAIDDYIAEAASGRVVALAFTATEWGARGGTHDFYPAGRNDYRHSAVLERSMDGSWQIRNTVATMMSSLVDLLGGNTVWFPAARLDEFRETAQGVAAEIQACGTPGCLVSAELNPWGLDLYLPVEQRGVPWRAVRVYVERDGALDALECTGGTMTDFPRAYAGTGNMTRTLTIEFDDMSTVTCEGTGAWAAVLQDDGTAQLTGEVNVEAEFGGGTTACRDLATPRSFFWSGRYDRVAETVTIDATYDGATFILNGSYNADALTITGNFERRAVVAGFGAEIRTEAFDLQLVR